MSSAPPPDWVLARRRQVGQQIRAVRLHANLTQERLALDAGLDRSYIVNIEQGHQSPTVDILIRIAAAIGVPLAELVR